MKLFSNNSKSKKPTFWVECYNEEEKKFFLALGFEEKISAIPDHVRDENGRGGNTLHFKGSQIFGLFSEEEYDKIVHAIFKDLLPNRKRLTVYQNYEF
jgi:hypothetical protein